MKIQKLALHTYVNPLITGQSRSGLLINIIDQDGNEGWGDIAPLPGWSKETLNECIDQLKAFSEAILKLNWSIENCFYQLSKCKLYPSVLFGLESALLTVLSPLQDHQVSSSALLMGSPKEILEQAEIRLLEGFTSAKLKVNNLSFCEASELIHQLKDKISLRIDVNRSWNTSESLKFFSQFPINTFEYVEEPFQNPKELALFQHTLAIDESFPNDVTLEELNELPTLKALIYKPTLQGGITGCLNLIEWSKKSGVEIVLSSSFESDIGLANVSSISQRLSLSTHLGIGTYHFMSKNLCKPSLKFTKDQLHIPSKFQPREELIQHVMSF